MLDVTEADLRNGDAVHTVVTHDGEVIEFEGRTLEPDSSTFTEQRYYVIRGNGAEYRNSFIHGLVADGSAVTVDIRDVDTVEVDRFDLPKTMLIVGGTAAVLCGAFMLYIGHQYGDSS
jgi:hypothetical protein